MNGTRFVIALLLLLGLSSCRRDDPVASGGATTTAAASGTDAQTVPRVVPYFLFNAAGWTLEAGLSSGPVIEAGASLGLKWNASYISRPSPNHDIGAALAVSDPPDGAAKEYAALLTGGNARKLTVGNHTAFAGEERGANGALTASHVAWDSDDYVVCLTIYETKLEDALKLAEHVSAVSKEQWDSTTESANAQTQANAR